jgi:hypothetical protein
MPSRAAGNRQALINELTAQPLQRFVQRTRREKPS